VRFNSNTKSPLLDYFQIKFHSMPKGIIFVFFIDRKKKKSNKNFLPVLDLVSCFCNDICKLNDINLHFIIVWCCMYKMPVPKMKERLQIVIYLKILKFYLLFLLNQTFLKITFSKKIIQLKKKKIKFSLCDWGQIEK